MKHKNNQNRDTRVAFLKERQIFKKKNNQALLRGHFSWR